MILLIILLSSTAPELFGMVKTDPLKFKSGIRSMFQDKNENFWIGSDQEGVALFNGTSFTYFTTTDGLPDNKILCIQEDKNGMIWIGTQNGVCRYDGTSFKNQTEKENWIPQGVWKKSSDDLWFAAGNKEGVYRYDGQSLYYLPFPKPKVINPNNLYAVTSLATGKHNMLWFGTYAGIFGFNGSEFIVINDESLGLDIKMESLHIRSIFEDKAGRLWIGNNGIGVLLKDGASITNFSRHKNLIHPDSKKKGDKSPPKTLEHVFAIAEDNEGNIWFGDRDSGIWKYDGKSMENFTTRNGLSNDFVRSIYRDKIGKIWLGLADGNVYSFNGIDFEKQF